MRAREFIVEYDRGITLRTTEQKLVARIANDSSAPDTVDETMELIEGVDPTPQNTYTPWLVNQYIKQSFDIRDLNHIKSIMSKYITVKKFIPPHDIGRLSFAQLYDMIENAAAKKESPIDVIPDTEVLYNGPDGQLAIPKTEAASIALGEGAMWCTSWTHRPNQFNSYSKSGDLYVWRDAKHKDKKYQFYWGDEIQFRDRANDHLSEKDMKYFREINPVTAPLFAREESTIIKSKDPAKFIQLAIALKKSNTILSIDNVEITHPELAYLYALEILEDRFPRGEAVIATDGYWSYMYAKDVINQDENGDGVRWPEGEKAIASDAEASYMYAKDVLNRNNPGKGIRFSEGEVAIIDSPNYVVSYASKVINRNNKGDPIRWPAGEKAIANNPTEACNYARFVLNNSNTGEGIRFVEAEPAIATDAEAALAYATGVINRNNTGKGIRWPEGEKTIATNPRCAYNYTIEVINRNNEGELIRWPEAEKAIATMGYYAREYDKKFGTNLANQ